MLKPGSLLGEDENCLCRHDTQELLVLVEGEKPAKDRMWGCRRDVSRWTAGLSH